MRRGCRVAGVLAGLALAGHVALTADEPAAPTAAKDGETMAQVTLKGTPVKLAGRLPAVGTTAPAFTLTAADLSEKTLADFAGKTKILSIVPSLDTRICALSAERFNREVGSLKNTVLINISADLPFAQKRFCESQSLAHVVTLSTFRNPAFGTDYGVRMESGPMAGLMSRAVLVLDAGNTVAYAEQVPEIAQEPAYDKVLAAARGLDAK